MYFMCLSEKKWMSNGLSIYWSEEIFFFKIFSTEIWVFFALIEINLIEQSCDSRSSSTFIKFSMVVELGSEMLLWNFFFGVNESLQEKFLWKLINVYLEELIEILQIISKVIELFPENHWEVKWNVYFMSNSLFLNPLQISEFAYLSGILKQKI